MIEEFPRGSPIGQMQAPLKWIITHTIRFKGLVTLKVGEGEGYVLIEKGRPIACAFFLGEMMLRGHAAYGYLKSIPILNMTIRRYNRDEFIEAKHVLNLPVSDDLSAVKVRPPVHAENPPDTSISQDRGLAAALEWEPSATLGTVDKEAPPGYPEGLDNETLGHLLLGKIIHLRGVQAVTIFGRGKTVLSIGDVDLESLVGIADDMLQAAKGISSVMDTGSFVHLTLQIPSGKVIIAPFYGEYLCILTSPDINLGQIRKILREMVTGPGQGRTDL